METKKVAAMAEAFSVRIQPHVCASPVSTAAALQIDACTANIAIQELCPYRPPEHFAVVDYPPESDLMGGSIPIPGGPGLGINLIPERV